jgi:hypothetical protein
MSSSQQVADFTLHVDHESTVGGAFRKCFTLAGAILMIGNRNANKLNGGFGD